MSVLLPGELHVQYHLVVFIVNPNPLSRKQIIEVTAATPFFNHKTILISLRNLVDRNIVRLQISILFAFAKISCLLSERSGDPAFGAEEMNG